MITNLLALIGEHPAMRHGVFKKLAERKLPPDKLAFYLLEMGAFCEASRPGGNVAKTLRSWNMLEQAERVEAIFASEAGHGDDFAQMARLLLGADSHATLEWENFWTENVSRPISIETQQARMHFMLRGGETDRYVYYSLGVMLVVEIAAHRQIIPGEVAAFIDSGFYGLTLSDVPYLDEHAGEQGAEHRHEETITAIIGSLEESGLVRHYLEQGCLRFLPALNAFYDRLEACIA